MLEVLLPLKNISQVIKGYKYLDGYKVQRKNLIYCIWELLLVRLETWNQWAFWAILIFLQAIPMALHLTRFRFACDSLNWSWFWQHMWHWLGVQLCASVRHISTWHIKLVHGPDETIWQQAKRRRAKKPALKERWECAAPCYRLEMRSSRISGTLSLTSSGCRLRTSGCAATRPFDYGNKPQ